MLDCNVYTVTEHYIMVYPDNSLHDYWCN